MHRFNWIADESCPKHSCNCHFFAVHENTSSSCGMLGQSMHRNVWLFHGCPGCTSNLKLFPHIGFWVDWYHTISLCWVTLKILSPHLCWKNGLRECWEKGGEGWIFWTNITQAVPQKTFQTQFLLGWAPLVAIQGEKLGGEVVSRVFEVALYYCKLLSSNQLKSDRFDLSVKGHPQGNSNSQVFLPFFKSSLASSFALQLCNDRLPILLLSQSTVFRRPGLQLSHSGWYFGLILLHSGVIFFQIPRCVYASGASNR